MYGVLYGAACTFDGQQRRLLKKLQVSVAWHHAGESSIDSASHKERSSPSNPRPTVDFVLRARALFSPFPSSYLLPWFCA